MKVRDAIRLIEDTMDGFTSERAAAIANISHRIKRGVVTIPGKPNDDLAAGTLNNILKQAGLK